MRARSPRHLFAVTFETVTPESAEAGDVAERGYIVEAGTLRDCADVLRWQGAAVSADAWPIVRPRWLTWPGDVSPTDSSERTLSLHLPAGVTAASARRIARLAGLGVRG